MRLQHEYDTIFCIFRIVFVFVAKLRAVQFPNLCLVNANGALQALHKKHALLLTLFDVTTIPCSPFLLECTQLLRQS